MSAATAALLVLLTVGGGPPGSAQFTMELAASGNLHVTKVVRSQTSAIDVHLARAQRDEMVRFAMAADDFDRDCNTGVADGTNASLRVGKVERTCVGGSRWPSGPHTRRLLGAINKHLTEPMKVY